MASDVAAVSGFSREPKTGDPINMFSFSDNEFVKQIYATHVHDDENFDVKSLFILVQNILKRATQIADNFLLMQCNAPGEETAYKKTVLSILNKLSNYSWEAKAVLTLAAFALDYGDFWLLAQTSSLDQLVKSVGILKRVPESLKKYKNSIDELNKVIKDTLKVIESIFDLQRGQRLLSKYDTKDVPALSIAKDHISMDVFWATITIVACTTQMCCLTNDGEKTQELSPFAQKINSTLNFLTKRIQSCYEQIEEMKAYRQLKRIIQTYTEIMEVLKVLIFAEDNLQEIFDGDTKKRVSIEVLRKKNVLLFFTGLNISNDEISILNPINAEMRKKKDQYEILWIPIVEKWTDELKKKFETLQSEMSWYIVQSTEPIVGIKYIKEEWKFENQPILVVMNPQGKVEHPNALQMIRVWGMKAFPFTKTFEEKMAKELNWFEDILLEIDPNLQDWIKQANYVLLYGGEEEKWIQEFGTKATYLENKEEMNISIKLVCLKKDCKIRGNFWTKIESLFISTKIDKQTEEDTVMRKIQKLLSFKNESGWAILSKGSRVVVSDIGTKIYRVLDEFEKEKGNERQNIEGFFKDKLAEGDQYPCSSFDIPFIAGKIPNLMKCSHCLRVMETYLRFKCCHIDGAMNAPH